MLRKIKILLGILIIVLGIILIEKNPPEIIYELKDQNENKIISEIINKKQRKQQETNYIGVISIPKIKLKKLIIKKSSKENNIEKNIKTIKYNKNEIILAAHSGTSNISYFKNLSKLTKDDKIYLYIKNKKYTYKVIKKYEVKKEGTIIVEDIPKQLILTTCSMAKKGKQLIIISIPI